MSSSHPGRQALLVPAVLGGSMLLLGGGYSVTDVALSHSGAGVVAAARAIVGALALLAVLPLFGSRLPRTLGGWAWAAGIGLGTVTLILIGISEATERAGPALAAVLVNTTPFFLVILAHLFLREHTGPLRLAGLAIGFAGVVLIVLAGPVDAGAGLTLGIGILIALVGACANAVSTLGVRHLALTDPDFDVLGMTAAQSVVGALALLPYALSDGSLGHTYWDSAGLWLAFAFLGVGGLALPILGIFFALSRWQSARVYAWIFLVPAIATIIELVRGHVPGGLEAAGIAVIILGVAIVNLPRAEGRARAREGYDADGKAVAVVEP